MGDLVALDPVPQCIGPSAGSDSCETYKNRDSGEVSVYGGNRRDKPVIVAAVHRALSDSSANLSL